MLPCLTHSEVRACIGKRQVDIQERDFCQLAGGATISKRVHGEKKTIRPHFWFTIGCHEKSLSEIFGGVENGRLRGFVQTIDKRQVIALTLKDKLAAHASSMKVLTKTQLFVATAQHAADEMAVDHVRHSPGTLIVMEAMHEAARIVAGEVDDADDSRQNAVPRALWPCIIKSFGKGLMSIVLANMWVRNGVWSLSNHAVGAAWVDSTTRFWDALAASFKFLVHLASQAYTEAFISSIASVEDSAGSPESGDGQQGGSQTLSALLRLPFGESAKLPLVAARLAEGICTADKSLATRIRRSFNTATHKELRKIRDAIGCTTSTWSDAVAMMEASGLVEAVPSEKGSWKLTTSAAAKGLLVEWGGRPYHLKALDGTVP